MLTLVPSRSAYNPQDVALSLAGVRRSRPEHVRRSGSGQRLRTICRWRSGKAVQQDVKS